VTKLLQCLRDELVRRDYAATTIRSYLQIVDAFRQHAGGRLDRITPAQLRRYHLFLLEDRRLAVGTVVTQICALRCAGLCLYGWIDMEQQTLNRA